jgi:hypothetical protein
MGVGENRDEARALSEIRRICEGRSAPTGLGTAENIPVDIYHELKRVAQETGCQFSEVVAWADEALSNDDPNSK